MKNEINDYPAPSAGYRDARPRWMVVDNHEGLLNLMALFLSRAGGAVVHRFQSAEKALAAFRAAPDIWELVLTDLAMPGMDGIELSSHLRVIRPDLKIFLTTGSGLVTEAEAKELGFCQLLCKPFRFSDLLRMLLAAGATDSSRAANRTSHTPVGVAA